VRVAVDTNVFSGLLSGEEKAVSTMQVALERVSGRGMLVASPIVYAELAAVRSLEAVDGFFSDKGIEVDWQLDERVWRAAGSRYGVYARTRRRQGGDDTEPRRILADFLIGAHALYLDRVLLTSDARIYGTFFSELEVLRPQEQTDDPA
jgi:predicted nucleic acid-binding protein